MAAARSRARPKAGSSVPPAEARAPALVLVLGAALCAVLLALGWRAFAPADGDGEGGDGDEVAATAQPKMTNKARAAARAYLPIDDETLRTDTLPPRRFKIIDVHEHVLDQKHAELLLEGMDALGVTRTALMGTTTYTFTLDNKYGFEGWQQNNADILAIKRWRPDRFSAFVTIDAYAPDALAVLQQAVRDGADGLKLYIGHGAGHGKGTFHQLPLDDPKLMPIYAYAERIDLPLVFHVNLVKYWDELNRVMQAHPKLRVDIPHFGLHKTTQKRLDKLSSLLKTYPNLYTDISFGWIDFHREGFESLAGNRERARRFITAHADKILYASDMVLEPSKDRAHVMDTMRSYMQLLEMEKFRFFLSPRQTMHGLALPDEALQKIYEDAPRAFLRLDEQGRSPDLTRAAP